MAVAGTRLDQTLGNGYTLVTQGKLPIVATDACKVMFDDGTSVAVAEGQLTVVFQGRGTLLCAKPEPSDAELDENCVIDDIRVEWSGKVLIRLIGQEVVFEDDSMVAVFPDGRVFARVVGEGALRVVRIAPLQPGCLT